MTKILSKKNIKAKEYIWSIIYKDDSFYSIDVTYKFFIIVYNLNR